MKVELFTTVGCHLCEQAEQLLNELNAQGSNIDICAIEIADSDDLMERYGIRIPVIRTPDQRELGWPFTLEELAIFLQAT